MLLNKLYRFTFLAGLLLIASISKAQDSQFSQFYANPLYLNPALAGATECARLNLNYRNQWPSLTNAFITYSISYDQSIRSINSGFGILLINDRQGNGALNTTLIGAFYSYNLRITEGLFMLFGVEGKYYQEHLEWEKFIFADQINRVTGAISPVSNETPPDRLNITAIDFSVGTVLAYYDKFFIGFAADHITQPNISFYDNEDNKLPLKYTAHGGVTINLSDGGLGNAYEGDIVLQPGILYMQQAEFQQINAGLFIDKKPLVIGGWFRHNFQNPDAVIILIGLKFNNIKFGYSYDWTVSKIGGEALGAHEISFSWDFCIYKGDKKRRIRAIKSPLF